MCDVLSLRQKFTAYVLKNWEQNDHSLKQISCIYAIVAIDYYDTKTLEIEYVGSSVNLHARYKSHKVPEKISSSGKISLMFYKPMSNGFYDYEIKLIKKIKPKYNKQHKNG